jgi:hypothetical protein
MSLKIVPLIFRTHQLALCGMEVIGNQTFSGICCTNKFLFFSSFSSICGEFGRETWLCDWTWRSGRDFGDGWDSCAIIIVIIKNCPCSSEDSDGKLNYPFNVSKQRPGWWCHIHSLSSIDLWIKSGRGQYKWWMSGWCEINLCTFPKRVRICSQTLPSRVVTIVKHRCSNWKIQKERAVMTCHETNNWRS